jgi:chemotaxis protein histidine kinase CheA
MPSNLPDPSLSELNFSEVDDILDLDFEAIFADAVADIVQGTAANGTRNWLPTLIEQPETLQRALSVATAPRRNPMKLAVRKLQESNLDSLFLNLSPLQLEELQPPEPVTPEPVALVEPVVPEPVILELPTSEPPSLEIPTSEISNLEILNLEILNLEPPKSELIEPVIESPIDQQPPQQPLQQLDQPLHQPLEQPAEELDTAALNLPQIPALELALPEFTLPAIELSAAELSTLDLGLDSEDTEPSQSELRQQQWLTQYVQPDATPLELPDAAECLIETPEVPLEELEVITDLQAITDLQEFQPESQTDVQESQAVAPDQAQELEQHQTPEMAQLPLEPIQFHAIQPQHIYPEPTDPRLTPETSAPTYPFPKCPLDVVTQLEGMQSLIGELVTQDNCLAQQHQELHVTLQEMVGNLVTVEFAAGSPLPTGQGDGAEKQLLAESLQKSAQLKVQLQRSQRTLRQQRQTLTKLHNTCNMVQLLPLQDLFQPLVDWSHKLFQAQQQAGLRQGYQAQPLNLVLGGCNTMIDQRLFLRLRQPLSELFRHLFAQVFTAPTQRYIPAQPLQINLWGYAWGQQIWLELRWPNQGLEVESHLSQLQTQVNALHGTVHHNHLPEGTEALTLRLPRFLPITQVLLVKVEQQLLALPLNTLTQVTVVAADSLYWQQGQPYYELPHAFVPIYPLKQCLQLATEATLSSDFNFSNKVALVCVGSGDHQVALQVDELLQEQELAVRPSTTFNKVQTPPYICGYGLLNEDKLVPILDPAPLLERLETYHAGTDLADVMQQPECA